MLPQSFLLMKSQLTGKHPQCSLLKSSPNCRQSAKRKRRFLKQGLNLYKDKDGSENLM